MLSFGLLRPSLPSLAQHHFTGLLVKDAVLISMGTSVKPTSQPSSHGRSPIRPGNKVKEDPCPGRSRHPWVFLIYRQKTLQLKNRLAGNLFKTTADMINERE